MAAQAMIAGITARLDEQPIRARQVWVLLLVQLILMIDGLDIQLLGLVAPVILDDWGVARADFGPALGASLFGLAIGAGVGGLLGDRFGRKRMLCISAFLFGVATLCAAFAQDVMQMTIIRFVSGLGFGAAAPSSIALVTEWMPRRAQAKAIALLSVGTPLGGLVGSLALQILLPQLGWRECFIACGVLTLIVALTMLVALPESAAYLSAKGDHGGARRLLKRYARIDIAEAELAAAEQAKMAALHMSSDTMFGRHYLRLNIGGWLLFFCAQFIAYAFLNWAPTFLTMRGFPIDYALQASFSFNLLAVAAAILTGFLVHALGSRRIIIGAALLGGLCIAALAWRLHGTSGLPDAATYWTVMIAIAGVGTFVSMIIAVGYGLLTLGYSEHVRATGIGVGLLVGRAGGVAIGLAGGILLSLSGDQTWPFFLVLIALSMAILIGTAIVDRHIPATR